MLTGTIIQLIAIVLAVIMSQTSLEAPMQAALAVLLFGGIPVLLLYFSGTQKVGAILSLFLGVLFLYFIALDFTVLALAIPGILGLSLIFASLYYFWKKY